MYKLNKQNQVETSPENLPNWSGFSRYLSSLPVQERQAQGWYKNLVEADIETTYIDAEKDTVYTPRSIQKTEETPFEFSPLKMEIDLEKRGKELGFDGLALLDGILNQAGLLRQYQRASVLDSRDEHIIQLMDVVATSFNWSKSQLKELMNSWKI